MSLRPADLSGVMSQTNNVERVSQAGTQQARTHQDVVAQQSIQQSHTAETQVQGTPPAEGNTIRDGEGGGGGAYGGGGRRRQPQEKAPEDAAPAPRPKKRKAARIDFRA